MDTSTPHAHNSAQVYFRCFLVQHLRLFPTSSSAAEAFTSSRYLSRTRISNPISSYPSLATCATCTAFFLFCSQQQNKSAIPFFSLFLLLFIDTKLISFARVVNIVPPCSKLYLLSTSASPIVRPESHGKRLQRGASFCSSTLVIN